MIVKSDVDKSLVTWPGPIPGTALNLRKWAVSCIGTMPWLVGGIARSARGLLMAGRAAGTVNLITTELELP